MLLLVTPKNVENLVWILLCLPRSLQSLQSQLNQLVSLTEYFRRDLEIAGLSKALDNLTAHENENVKKRALIILTRIKAQKLVEQE